MKKLLIIVIVCLLSACNDPLKENHLAQESNQNSLEIDAPLNEALTSDNSSQGVIEMDESNTEENIVEEAFQAFVIVIGVERLNVRKNADQESEKMGQVLLNEKYMVHEIKTIDQKSWYKVNYKGQDAWIAGWFTYKANDPIIRVYSEKNRNSDFLGYLDYDKVSYEKSSINGIEASKEGLLFWSEVEFNGKSGYCHYDEDRKEYVFDENLHLIIDDKSYTIETKDKFLDYLMDSIKNQMLIIVGDHQIYLDGQSGNIAFDDAALMPPEPSLNPYRAIYSSGSNRLYPEENRVYIINGRLANSKFEFVIGHYEVEEYEIMNGFLSPVVKYEITGIARENMTYAYTSIETDEIDRSYYTITLEELNQNKCQEIIIYLDEANYRKYYSFEVDGQTHYCKEGFRQVPKQTKVVIGASDYIIPGNVDFVWYTNYNGEYFEYIRNDKKFLYNINIETSFEMDKVFYDMDLDHLIIVKDQTYYLYKNTQKFDLIWQEEFDGYISLVNWHEQSVIIEFNDDDHNYDNYFRARTFLNIEGDQVTKVKDSSQVLNVYSERNPQALATDTLKSASKSYGSTSLSLSLTDNSPIVWGKTNEGYLKNDLFNIRFKPYNLYSDYSTPHYNEVLDASENLIIEDAYLERSLLEHASIYILSKSNDKYVYNIQTKDLEKIGFDYILTHDLNYIIGFSRDDKNVKISLMDPYLMTVLDTLSFSVDVYIDHEYKDGKLYIETVKPEEEDLVSFIREASYIEIIEQSFSLVNENYKEEGIKVYDQVGKNANKLLL